jgi:hypothetical protein
LEQPQLPAMEPNADAAPSNTAQSSSLFREIVETLLLTVVIFVLNTITGACGLMAPVWSPTCRRRVRHRQPGHVNCQLPMAMSSFQRDGA